MSQISPCADELCASEEDGPRLVCEAIPEFSSEAWRLRSCAAVEAKKQRGQRIVVYAFSYTTRDDPHRVRHGRVVAKRCGEDRGGVSHRAQTALWDAGLRPPAPFRVPKSYGWAPHLGVLLQEHIDATAWADRLGGPADDLRRASTQAATWLVHLQCSGVEASDPGRPAESGAAQPRCDRLARSYPHARAAILGLATELDRRLRADTSPLVPSHGDLRPTNVLLDGQWTTTVIDFDHFGSRSAAFDIGYAIGQLHLMSHLRLGDLAPGASASAAFWRGCQLAGRARWADVAAHVARTLLQRLSYELCVLKTGKADLLPLCLRMAEAFLDHDELPRPRALGGRR